MRVLKKILGLLAMVAILMCLLPANLYAKTLESIKVKPEDVGVFLENKTQQFQAIAKFSDKSEEDYTLKVGWSLQANPLSGQSIDPSDVATIDADTGLATVKNSWGRINVVATYPKPITPQPALAGVYDLLLEKEIVHNIPRLITSVYLLLLKKEAK